MRTIAWEMGKVSIEGLWGRERARKEESLCDSRGWVEEVKRGTKESIERRRGKGIRDWSFAKNWNLLKIEDCSFVCKSRSDSHNSKLHQKLGYALLIFWSHIWVKLLWKSSCWCRQWIGRNLGVLSRLWTDRLYFRLDGSCFKLK